MMLYYKAKSGYKPTSSLEDTTEIVIFSLTLNTVNNFFCMTLWLIMLHYHTRFGNKMFFGSEDIIQTFTDILNLCCGLELECSNPIFQQDTLAYNVVLSNQLWLQMD